MKKVHGVLCLFLWCFWFVGILSVGILNFDYFNQYNDLFWKIIEPYNRIVILASLIPVEPIICLCTIVYSKFRRISIKNDIILFFITFLFWIIYINVSSMK